MNKQEFMNCLKHESRASANDFIDSNNLVFQGEARAYQNASLLCENLDEPQKVKVPEFVADWIEEVKQRGCGLADALDCFASPIMPDNIKEWLEFNSSVIGCHHDHQELLARAWLDGYEVEEEPKYQVKLKFGRQYLSKNADGTALDFYARMQPIPSFSKSELSEIEDGAFYKADGDKEWINPIIELVPVEKVQV